MFCNTFTFVLNVWFSNSYIYCMNFASCNHTSCLVVVPKNISINGGIFVLTRITIY
ncbi:hypothetical protein SAMN03080601_01002 [Alkalitalea saponilacus]|uniref:Uncharacterized protein n=1 Tax=Alkalitalea saponilacus TaxID=889453 RepID=A0A1T5D6P0_9BACT|nr:hypothetical protein SAMN03080601_01002 [Alkalitalea saponilacus]